MAGTASQTIDVTQVVASVLSDIEGLRAYWYVADVVRPPAAVVGQPDIDYADNQSGFCSATWTVPLTVVTSRTNDRDAQVEMSRLLSEIVAALGADVPDVFDIQPLDARPITVAVQGQDMPGYLLNIRVRA